MSGKLKNRQIICCLNSIKFYIDNCERSYQKFYIKLFSRMWIFRQILSDQSLLQRAVIDFKFGEEAKVIFLLFSWTLGLTFVFSSPPSSAFAYNVIIKKLFLGDLRKSPRWNVKERNCVQLIFSYQIRTVNTFQRLRLSIKTSILEKAVKVKAFNFVNDYKFIFQSCNIMLLFSCTVWAIHLLQDSFLLCLPLLADRVCVLDHYTTLGLPGPYRALLGLTWP